MNTISVIVPVKDRFVDIPLLDSLKKVVYPQEKIEIILSIGKWPSVQRNRAAKMAKGDILYFFNKDAHPEPNIFKKAVDIFNKDSRIVGVGGPDLTPKSNGYIQHLFGFAMSSYFAVWKMRARYSQIGEERLTDERELLLSNLAIRKDIFLQTCGFNEKIYPNEENELINRISKMGYKFIYSPDIIAYRDRRRNVIAFIRQFYGYGQGRINQIFIERSLENFQFLIPLFFVIYLIILLFVKKSWSIFIPLFAYIIFGAIDAVYLSYKNKRNLFFTLPLIYITMHVSYAIGMLSVLLQRLGLRYNKRKELITQEVIIKKAT